MKNQCKAKQNTMFLQHKVQIQVTSRSVLDVCSAHTVVLHDPKSTGDTVMPSLQFLSLELFSKLLTTILQISKLALYLTRKKINERFLDNNWDLRCFLK